MKSRNHEQPGQEAAGADDLPLSKSQRKREALAVRSLAAQLIRLGGGELRQLPLEPETLQAIHEARQIRSNVARKRQMQYVARLLRLQDTEEIEAAIDKLRREARHNLARQHRSEAWRDRLLESGDQALQELMQQRRDIDAPALRALVRRAQQERATVKPPAAARALFRMLFELDAGEPLPPA